jgi:hypothetical protein
MWGSGQHVYVLYWVYLGNGHDTIDGSVPVTSHGGHIAARYDTPDELRACRDWLHQQTVAELESTYDTRVRVPTGVSREKIHFLRGAYMVKYC